MNTMDTSYKERYIDQERYALQNYYNLQVWDIGPYIVPAIVSSGINFAAFSSVNASNKKKVCTTFGSLVSPSVQKNMTVNSPRAPSLEILGTLRSAAVGH